MTEDTYTIEQIDRLQIAFENADVSAKIFDKVIAELQRPAWEFAEGEVIVGPSGQLFRFGFALNPPQYADCRRQNLTEHGPAVKALRDAAMRLHDAVLTIPTDCFDERTTLADALKAFDEVVI